MTNLLAAEASESAEPHDHTSQLLSEDLPNRGAPIARRRVILLFGFVFAVRLLFSIRRTSVVLTPDELANLGMARFLSGQNWVNFSGNTYQPGLPSLLAPAFVVVEDPEWRYRTAIAVGAVLGGLAAVLMVRLILRLTEFRGVGALLVAAGVALTPASLGASDHVWAEPLVTLSFLTTLSLVLRFFEDRRLTVALLACGAGAAGYLSHGRLLPLALTTMVLLAGAYVASRDLVRGAAVVVAALSMIALVHLYSNWVFDTIWLHRAPTNTSSGVLRRLQKPHEVLDAALGQVWYLVGATLFIGGYGFVELVRRGWFAGRTDRRERLDARLVLCLTAPLLATSIVFMSDRPRPDHLIYGRYTDAVLWPVLAVGVSWLVHRWGVVSTRFRRWAVGGFAVLFVELGLFLHVFHARQLGSGSAVMEMVPGVDLYVNGGRIRPLVVTSAALALALVLIGVRHLAARRPAAAPAALAVALFGVLAVAGVDLHRGYADGVGSYSDADSFARLMEGDLADVTSIGVALVPDSAGPAASYHLQASLAMAYQWNAADVQFQLDTSLRDDVGPYVLAPTNDIPLALNGGTVVWADPQYDVALWLEPTEEELGPEGSERYTIEELPGSPTG